MFTNNLAQPAPNAIADNRTSDRARRDQAGAKTVGVVHRKNAEHDQLAAIDPAVLLYALEFRGPGQAATFGKCEAFDRADDIDLTGKEPETNQVGAIDLNRSEPDWRCGWFREPPLPIISVQQKSFAPQARGERLRK
jgi:hypothetical protein